MSKIVRVAWMNPARRMEQYPEALDGINIEHKIDRPAHEYFFVANSDAQKLKEQIEQRVRGQAYTLVDDKNKPIIQGGNPVVMKEPEVEIIDIP
jgi:hypothetical protein